jgi:hypothetical protein
MCGNIHDYSLTKKRIRIGAMAVELDKIHVHYTKTHQVKMSFCMLWRYTGRVEVWLHTLLTSALMEVSGQLQVSVSLPPWKEPSLPPIEYAAGWAPVKP